MQGLGTRMAMLEIGEDVAGDSLLGMVKEMTGKESCKYREENVPSRRYIRRRRGGDAADVFQPAEELE